MKALKLLLVCGTLGGGFLLGWLVREFAAPVGKAVSDTDSIRDQEPIQVIAQGTLVPRSGLVNVFGPPNQVVESIAVTQGQTIRKNETELATFPLYENLQRQAALAAAQASEAKHELAQKVAMAQGQVEAAQLAVSLAELQLRQAETRDLLEIPERKLAAAKAKLARLENLAKDPKTEAFVATTAIDEQKLAITEAEIQLTYANKQHASAREAAALELEAARSALARASEQHKTLAALQQQETSADLAVSAAKALASEARILAPLDGVVVQVLAKAGDVALPTPIMQVADLSQMDCVAEVPDRLISQISVGNEVKLQSLALERELTGRVVEITPVVGNSSLPNPNPLALVDRESVRVRIELNENDVPVAAKLINLQVTVIFSTK
ncbi:MAG: HlyD family efflux transporter periplasmic adaptor subunit [Planctomycetaceae bacterium]|nr:HlyD family efflux transporter periplasmic adaptor subunit [Planctomycetaceae bacterium]